jgi:hypothetical protein
MADPAQYAEDERFPCSDSATAEKIFDQHHVFLMMSFMNRAQGIGWSNTPLYQHFRRKYPVGNIKSRNGLQSNERVERLRKLQSTH